MATKVEVSHKTIIFTVVFLALLWVLLQIRDILFILFISFLVMTALRPLVDIFERFRIPRIISVLLIYVVVFGLLGWIFGGMIPQLVNQTGRLVQDFPSFVNRVLPYANIDVRSLTNQLAPIGENIFRFTVGIFSNLATLLTVLVFTFYFLLERGHIDRMLSNIMGEDAADRVLTVLSKVESRLGSWVLGQVSLMFIVGLAVYIGLAFVLHLDYALPLAILAGLLEIVPVIGPIVAGVPAVLVALATSPLLALSVVALYFIIQQVENHLLVPIIMRQSVGLSPLITILSLMIGGKLAGITGAILAVPVLLVILVLLQHFVFDRETKEG